MKFVCRTVLGYNQLNDRNFEGGNVIRIGGVDQTRNIISRVQFELKSLEGDAGCVVHSHHIGGIVALDAWTSTRIGVP